MNAASIYNIQKVNWRNLFALYNLEKLCFKDDAWPLIELIGLLTFPGVVRYQAVVAGEMVGFVAGDARRSENTGWILTLGVHPQWRRKGIAKDLMEICEKEMGMSRVKLTVRRGNQSALNLYLKLGYKQVDIWSHYYHSGEDGLVLEKTLTQGKN
jgi:ribosomal-protein-alanine N-acetyltransferase